MRACIAQRRRAAPAFETSRRREDRYSARVGAYWCGDQPPQILREVVTPLARVRLLLRESGADSGFGATCDKTRAQVKTVASRASCFSARGVLSMKSAIRATATITAFLVGLAACNHQISPPEIVQAPSIDLPTFQSCVDREAKTAFQRHQAENYGYPVSIENDVISICNPRLMLETVNDNVWTSNPMYKYVNGVVDALVKSAQEDRVRADIEADRKRAELDAPRLKAEKAEEESELDEYYKCLIRHARVLAVNSNEPAAIIAKATFPSCINERQEALEVYRRHKNNLADMDLMDKLFEQPLLLEIIKARAQPSEVPSSSAKTKPEAPI